jgi:hypothetical protein
MGMDGVKECESTGHLKNVQGEGSVFTWQMSSK